MDRSKGAFDSADGSEVGMGMDDDQASMLWAEISGYSSWVQHEQWEGVVSSDDGTHGAYVQIWFNEPVEQTVAGQGTDTMPDGAILVKEGYDDAAGTPVNGVTAMKKIPGFAPENGDWFWASYEPDGTVKSSGSVAFCIGCHAVGQDSVRFVSW